MDRNAKERQLFKEWAKSNHRKDCFIPDPNKESYFIKRRQDENYIWKYDFESVPQFRDFLEEQWKNNKDMEDILTAVLVAAIKNKPRNDDTGYENTVKRKESENIEELPMYIYNF